MTEEDANQTYTGEEAPESPELMDKVRRLSPAAQSVLYAMLIEEGEDETTNREGFTPADIQQACAACSLDDTPTPQNQIDTAIDELREKNFIEERNGRLYLITKPEHMRTFEKSIESSMFVVRR